MTVLNPALTASVLAEMIAVCDYATPNETDAEAITGISIKSPADAMAAPSMPAIGAIERLLNRATS